MTNSWADNPYRTIGWHLKFAREQLKETIAEVCGAVEIDEMALMEIENGERRPSEEVLLLLISHLNMEDAEATSLWELAGYDKDDEPTQPNPRNENRTIYTDRVNVTVNDYGVVLDFMQADGPSHFTNVAKVGMSKEHAKYLLDVLQDSLVSASQPKVIKSYLPQPKKRNIK